MTTKVNPKNAWVLKLNYIKHLRPKPLELFGQGLSNISSGLSGSYPVSGSFSRSSVCVAANGFSGFTSIVSSIVVGLSLLLLTGTLFYLPHANLGIIIILAVLPLIEIKKMIEIIFQVLHYIFPLVLDIYWRQFQYFESFH